MTKQGSPVTINGVGIEDLQQEYIDRIVQRFADHGITVTPGKVWLEGWTFVGSDTPEVKP